MYCLSIPCREQGFLRRVPVTAYHLLLAAPVYAALLWLKRLQTPKMGG